MTDEEAAAIRSDNRKTLADFGLHAAEWLPMPNARTPRTLRPAADVARRLMGLHATVAWCCATEELVSSRHLTEYIDKNELFEMLTDTEREIVNAERERAALYREQVSWFTENMWALAWVLGFDITPRPDGVPITSQVGPPLNRDFLELFEGTAAGIASKCGLRSPDEVIALEDLYYCAHNAFRALAFEHKDAMIPCGVVRERRHALAWTLSPGVAWEHTDLST